MKILAIETSCDETAAAVVRDGRFVLSNIVASQAALHAQTGGVVPEVAAREHVQAIVPVVDETLRVAGVSDPRHEIDLLAVTCGPGLVSALLVGITTASSLAFAWDKRVVPAHHIRGHIYANQVLELGGARVESGADFVFPSLCLTVSGGHTELVLLRGHGDFEILGTTLDDAAGEAFDKVASLLGLGYPGGPAISHAAAGAGAHGREAFSLPKPLFASGDYNFSFSGLKTAVLRAVRELPDVLNTKNVQEIAASFEKAVVDVLLHKTFRAASEHGAVKIMLSGGVAANVYLRQRFEQECSSRGIAFSFPPISLCTDNAAMIGAAAFFEQERAVAWDELRPRLQVAF